jgi:hypothetical protein
MPASACPSVTHIKNVIPATSPISAEAGKQDRYGKMMLFDTKRGQTGLIQQQS